MKRNGLLIGLIVILLLSAIMPTASVAAIRPKVAVLYFRYTGKTEQIEQLSLGFAQMLTTRLQEMEHGRWETVERERLQDILDEQDLGRSGRVNQATAAKIGELLGAKYQVVGGYFEIGNMLRVDARLVEVKTGKVLGAIGAFGDAQVGIFEIQEKLAQAIERFIVTRAISLEFAEKQVASAKQKLPPRNSKVSAKEVVALSDALKDVDNYRRDKHHDSRKKEAAAKKLKELINNNPTFSEAQTQLAFLEPKG